MKDLHSLNEYISQVKVLHSLNEYISEQLSDVKTHWHPKKDLFTSNDPQEIVDYLMKNSKDQAQAMQRLCFYMNRAGDNLSNKTVLNKAKQLLKKEKVDEKLVINKNYKNAYTCVPKSSDELRKIIEDRYDKLGPGTKDIPIDFNDIDVSNIISFYNKDRGTFSGTDFEYIDISNWNVSNVKSMSNMFYGCEQLKSVGDLSNWNVQNVKGMNNIFNDSEITNKPKWYKK